MEEKPKYKMGEEVLFPAEDANYNKGIITKFIRGTEKVIVEDVLSGDMYECPLRILEKILSNDINYRFRYYEDLVNLTIYKEIKSIIAAGEGGIGKSYVLQQVLESEEFVEDKDYCVIKGHVSPYALYKQLEEFQNKPVIFDDCDAIFRDTTSVNILKAVIDTYSVRKVKWLTAMGAKERVSNVFTFTGSVIFLTNLNIDQIPQPILSRTIPVDLSMTSDEKIERMRHIIKYLPEMASINEKDKMRLIDMLDRYKNLLNDFNLRSLIKAGNILKKTGNWDYVRVSILSS